MCAIFIKKENSVLMQRLNNVVLLQTSPLIRNNELYLKKYFC